MKRFLPVFILPALIFSFAACKKSHNDTPQKTKTELITQSNWKFDHATATCCGDISSQLPACKKDDILTFASNGTGVDDEGATKCNAGDPQSSNFTWNFASNETMLHISVQLFPGASQDFSLVTLDDNNLVLSQTITNPPLGPVTVYFKH